MYTHKIKSLSAMLASCCDKKVNYENWICWLG